MKRSVADWESDGVCAKKLKSYIFSCSLLATVRVMYNEKAPGGGKVSLRENVFSQQLPG